MAAQAALLVYHAAAHEHLHDHRSFPRQLLLQGVELAAGGKQPNAITPEVAAVARAAAIAATAVAIPIVQPATMSSGEVVATQAAAVVPAAVPAGGWKRCSTNITAAQQSKFERDLAARITRLQRLSTVRAAAGSVATQQSTLIPITTYLHVMTVDGQQGLVSGAQISSQILVLNSAFSSHGFEFR